MAETRVCPNCGSDDVSLDRTGIVGKLGLDTGYECGHCGFSGKLFPMIDEADVDEHREAVREEREVEALEEYEQSEPAPDRGRFLLGMVMLVLGLGSVPVAFQSLTGAIGALLVPIGLSVMYREYKKAR